MTGRLRIVVLGEGRNERGAARAVVPLARVPREKQGAMEILVRRMLYEVLGGSGEPWHATLDDQIDVLEPPLSHASAVDVLASPAKLGPMVLAALKPVRGEPAADLFVLSHDADGCEAPQQAATAIRNTLGVALPMVIAAPELEAWLTSKRAVERVYEREHCTVDEAQVDQLQADAKAELKRLLRGFGGTFSSRMHARLAESISREELVARQAWSGWRSAVEALLPAIPPHFFQRDETP